MTRGNTPTDMPDRDETGADAPSAAPPRRRGGAARWAIVVVVTVLACALAALGPDAATWWNLQRWSTTGPKKAAEALRTAIDAGDATALKGIMLSPEQVVQDADGNLALRTSTRGGASTVALDRLRLAQTTDDTGLQYVTVTSVPEVRMVVPLAVEEGTVTLTLVRDGGWKVAQLRIRGGVMREIRGPLSPEAKQKSAGPKSERKAGGGPEEGDPTNGDEPAGGDETTSPE